MIRELKEVGIYELSKYLHCDMEVLGLHEEEKTIIRDIEKIDAQYDKDIYAKLLKYLKKHPNINHSDIRKRELKKKDNETVCFSSKNKLYLASMEEWMRFNDKILFDALVEPTRQVKYVVELGCGYGNNFSVLRKYIPDMVWVGGEYSKNAIEIASRLFNGCEDVSVVPFNWYDDRWEILEKLEEKAVIFTRHSIEELPRARTVLKNLAKYKDKISEVIHLEPVYELMNQNSVLGFMRRKYIRKNDYNTDLLNSLYLMGVEILQIDVDVIGQNPLNPTSLVKWKFKD